MNISKKFVQRINDALKSPKHFIRNFKKSDNLYSLRSRSFSNTNNYIDKNRNNDNLTDIIKFLNTGKIISSKKSGLNIKNDSMSITKGRNDLLSTYKKVNRSLNSPDSIKNRSFDYSKSRENIHSYKKREYIINNYNKVFSEKANNLFNNDNYINKKFLKQKDEILYNIHAVRNSNYHKKSKTISFVNKLNHLWNTNFESISKNNMDYYFNENKKCLLNEINSLKNELQKDVNKQQSKIGHKFISKKTKKYNTFRIEKKFRDEINDDNFFNELNFDKKGTKANLKKLFNLN